VQQASLLAETQEKLRFQQQGWEKKKQYMKEGQASKVTRIARMAELKQEIERLEKELKTALEAKDKAAAAEKATKEAHPKAGAQLETHCKDLETKVEGLRSSVEALKQLVNNLEYDRKAGKQVTLDPVLKQIEGIELDIPSVPRVCQAPSAPVPKAPTAPTTGPRDPEDSDDDHGLIDGEDEEDPEEESKGSDAETVEYDEDSPEVTAAVLASSQALTNYNNKNKELTDAQRQLTEAEQLHKNDFGEHEEYAVMHPHCYSIDTLEYTYEFCPYSKAAQKPRRGGGHTQLGDFTGWAPLDGDAHGLMKFENGQKCWGGPNRSLQVKFICGAEHKVLSVEEPAKCEYAMVFATPMGCTEPAPVASQAHQEL